MFREGASEGDRWSKITRACNQANQSYRSESALCEENLIRISFECLGYAHNPADWMQTEWGSENWIWGSNQRIADAHDPHVVHVPHFVHILYTCHVPHRAHLSTGSRLLFFFRTPLDLKTALLKSFQTFKSSVKFAKTELSRLSDRVKQFATFESFECIPK